MPFLRARWVNLLLITFAVPDDWVRPFVPVALSLDRFDDRAHVSLVAFQFQETRVLGTRIPGHVNFPEVNLRTYVRYGQQRGVLFLREFVPRRLVAAVARLMYNKPYVFTPMSAQIAVTPDAIRAAYRWGAGTHASTISVTASPMARVPARDSIEHHLKEHEWGYGTTRRGDLLQYRVHHPVWAVHDITSLVYTIDFGALYGSPWAALNTRTPQSTIFAAGSAVSVDRARMIRRGAIRPIEL